MLDINEEVVEITISADGHTVWVNVLDGCVCRCYVKEVIIVDDRVDKNTTMPSEYVTANEAAKILGFSTKTFLNLVNRKDIELHTSYKGKKVWDREKVLKLAQELKDVL